MRHKPWRVHRVGSWWPRTKISWYLGNSKHLEQQNKMFSFSWLSSARICPWLWCTSSPFPSGNSFILQVGLVLAFLRLFLGPGWREMCSCLAMQVCITHCALCLEGFAEVSVWHVLLPLPGLSSNWTISEMHSLLTAYTNTCTDSLLDAFFLRDTNITWFSLSHIHTHPYLPTTYHLSHCLCKFWSVTSMKCKLHGRVKTNCLDHSFFPVVLA